MKGINSKVELWKLTMASEHQPEADEVMPEIPLRLRRTRD
jgi:hypothetical protein